MLYNHNLYNNNNDDNNNKTGGHCRYWYEQVYFFPPSALGDMRSKTQFIRACANHTLLTLPYARHILWCLRSQLIFTDRDSNRSNLIRSKKSNHVLRWSNLNSSLFQNAQILRPSLPDVTSSTHSNCVSSHISCLGVYYDRWWMLYPFRAGVRVHSLTLAPE